MIKLNNISKIFNANDPNNLKVALDDINLTINEGEFVTVIGSNGSGKSTLFNIISGNYLPSSGNIFIDDFEVTKLKNHKRAKDIGVVFQDPLLGTASEMSILENLALANIRDQRKTLKWGFNKQDNDLYINKLKSLNLGLESRLTEKIGLLSGGQRQAITLLMATLQRPKLLLLDEHTAALDPKTANTVLDLTESLVKEQKLTTVMVTHNMRDALKYGNRLLMLSDGKIVLDIKDDEKRDMTIEKLVHLFYEN